MKQCLIKIILVCICCGQLVAQEPLPIVYDLHERMQDRELFTKGEVPDWVDVVHCDYGLHPEERKLLYDKQCHVEQNRSYYRIVKRFKSIYDAQDHIYLEFGLNPHYEKLVIHHIQLIRDGKVYDRLASTHFEVMQREEMLEARIYTGALHLMCLIDDLQAGDVIDYCFSLEGKNPLFSGHFTDCFDLKSYTPYQQTRFRYLVPKEHSLTVRLENTEMEPTVQPFDATTEEWMWEINDPVKIEALSNVPIWYDPTPMVHMGDFADWNACAQWGSDLYTSPTTFSEEIQAQVAMWMDTYETKEEYALAAVRFVQRKIRYMAYCPGLGGLVPANPNEVFKKRFGDCKGKSHLLCCLLRLMGIEAHPALVNAHLGRGIENWLPDPGAFNHAIATITIDGTTYWVDATDSTEVGPLSSRGCLHYGVGLILHPNTTALTPIPEEQALVNYYRHIRLQLSPNGADDKLTVNTQLQGSSANSYNVFLQRRKKSEVIEELQDIRSEEYGPLTPLTTTAFDLKESDGVFQVSEEYHLDHLWISIKKGKKHYFNYGAFLTLSKLDTRFNPNREHPLALTYPLNIQEQVLISGLSTKKFEPIRKHFSNDALTCTLTGKALNKTTYALTCHFQTLKDHVPVDQIPDHHALVSQIDAELTRQIIMKSKKR